MAEPFPVAIALEEGLATLRIQRGSARNALSPELVAALRRSFAELAGEPSVKAIVLTGTPGYAFAAGIDLRAVCHLASDEIALYFENVARLLWEVAACPKPVIAAVSGPALGAGADLAVACDVRVAAPDATFAFPGLAFGLVLGMARLARLVGPGRAKHLVFTGRRLGAAEAQAFGLVDLVGDDHLGAALAIGQEAAQRPAEALAAAKTCCGAGTLQDELDPVLASVRRPGFAERLRDFAGARLGP